MLVLRKNKRKAADPLLAANKEKFAQLNREFHGFSRHLKPFHYKRLFLAEILELTTAVREDCYPNSTNRENIDEDDLTASESGNDGDSVFCFSHNVLEVLNPTVDWAKHKSELKQDKTLWLGFYYDSYFPCR
jgi:hypothetical protein